MLRAVWAAVRSVAPRHNERSGTIAMPCLCCRCRCRCRTSQLHSKESSRSGRETQFAVSSDEVWVFSSRAAERETTRRRGASMAPNSLGVALSADAAFLFLSLLLA